MSLNIPHRKRWWLYLIVALVLLFLLVPTLVVIPVSFNATMAMTFPPSGWSLRWYEAFFEQEKWVGALWVSLRVALGTMVVATVTGTAAAYGLQQGRFGWQQATRTLLVAPLAVPSVLIAVSIFFVYAALGHLLNTIWGLILAHSVVAMPFVVLTMMAGFKRYDADQERAAISLGANRWVAFFTVTLPQLKFSIMTAMLLAFLVSFDEVIIALMVSSGKMATLPRVTFATLRDNVDPTLAVASTLMLLLMSLPPLVLYLISLRAVHRHDAVD